VLDGVAEDGLLTRHRLLRYRFADGVPGDPQVVWAGETDFFGGFHQRPLLVEGRYVVTQNAGVIDLHSGQAVLEERFTDLLGVEDGKVYFRRRGAQQVAVSEAFGSFELATGQTHRLGEPGKWELPGVHSPDGCCSAEVRFLHTITLHRIGRESLSLGDDFQVSYSRLSSTVGRPPVLWLDDRRLLTQIGNGKLVVVNVDDGTRSKPINCQATTEIVSAPRLWRDANGDVVYECGRDAHRIDVCCGSARRYERRALGHGFEMAMATAEAGANRHAVWHDGRAIGVAESRSWHVAVEEGHLALLGDGEVWAWSARSRRWVGLKPGHPEAVVGWVLP
jgi:hypothetical protein